MANLNESDLWEEGVYQLEEDDPVLGGPTGVDNKAPRQLANRARYQRLRNVTPWDASFTYPANVAYVSYGGTTWKSVGESLNVAPGADAAKWVRWAFTAAELSVSLGNAVAEHEAKVDPHPQYATDAALAAHAEAPNAHGNYVRHDAAQGLSNPQAAQARTNIGAEATGVAVNEVQKGTARYGTDTGAANAAAVAYTPAIAALTDGMVLLFAAAATNTGAATLNVNGLGAKPVLGAAQVALQGGEIVANGKCTVVWNATLNSFVLLDCTGAARQVGAATQSAHAVPLAQLGLRGVVSLAALGAGSWTVPAGVYSILAKIWGGGGGGGGAGSGGGTAGGGGGAGSSWKRLAVTPGQVLPYFVGSGGPGGGAGGGGTPGTATTFNGTMTASPGLGGSVNPSGNGGGGGTATGGDVNMSGAPGGTGSAGNTQGGSGGGSGGGGAGGGGAQGPAGGGGFPGGGGGGGGSSATGGAGAHGLIVILY